MVSFLKDCNDSKGQGHLMIFDHHRDGDFPRDGDCPRDSNHTNGGHPGDRLEDFDHFGKGDLPRDGDPPKNGDHHRDGDHPKDGGCLIDYHPNGWLLNFGSVDS